MAKGSCHITTALRRFVWLCALTACCLSVFAEQIKLEQMQVGSRIYKKVSVLGFNATDVYFTHSKGISNAKLKNLDDELKKLFNYDPKAGEIAERQQYADNEEFNKQVVVTIEHNSIAASVLARRKKMTTEENLADPLSENSPIGKAMPELKVERWIGGKPEVREHFQLIYLWAPWSAASKKFLPDVSALQGKFTKDVVFFGLVSEAANDPETDAGVKAEFPTAIDSTEGFIGALGVTSVPQVVLVDPKGNVRYIGHPAALTEKRLQEIVGKFGGESASKQN